MSREGPAARLAGGAGAGGQVKIGWIPSKLDLALASGGWLAAFEVLEIYRLGSVAGCACARL